MSKHIFLISSLLIVWVILSGYIEPFFIISGVGSCVLVYWIVKRMDIIDNKYPMFIIPMLPFYLIWLYKEIIVSSIDVAVRTWRATPDIEPVIQWVPASQKNDLSKTLYANSITLTPGTVCVDVNKKMLEVHALSKSGIEGLLSGEMDKKVKRTAG